MSTPGPRPLDERMGPRLGLRADASARPVPPCNLPAQPLTVPTPLGLPASPWYGGRRVHPSLGPAAAAPRAARTSAGPRGAQEA